jgi:beta-glucanase (GH16 family)
MASLLTGGAAEPMVAAPPPGFELVWSDEFEGSSLDELSWWYRADEKQQSIQLPENVSVEGGSLKLSLTPLATPVNGFHAAGAGVISQQRFGCGYYETRSRLGDGNDDDNDGSTDEGWWHAFWAMAAEGQPDGTVTTTFPAIRRTEIDGYENGSNDLSRFTQHVLPWNSSGQIIARLPSNDVSMIPADMIHDWHTYGFEWSPSEVRFYVDDVFQHAANYPADRYEHDEINVWLTAISTNNQSSDQELSEARYDYFRFYGPRPIEVGAGESLQIGSAMDLAAPVGGSITGPGFVAAAPSVAGVQADVVVEAGGLVTGAGVVHGDLTLRSEGHLQVATAGSPATSQGNTTVEDFEGFAPGRAFAGGAPTGRMPGWRFYDLGAATTDAVFAITGADTTAAEPSDPNLVGETQMLFQTNPDIDFAREAVGNEPFAGAAAVTSDFDTSGSVDLIEVDFVFDGHGDASGANLDAKIVFGFRDIDNWYSLSLVAGSSSGASTQIDVIANVEGERHNVFASSGQNDFIGAFPQDKLLHTKIVHDAGQGFVAFSITDPQTGEVLAEAFAIDDRFRADGDVGLAVNNDAVGIDNLVVTTQDVLPLPSVQTLTVKGDYVQEAAATATFDLASGTIHDQLEVIGSATLGGTLELVRAVGFDAHVGELLPLIVTREGIFHAFDEAILPASFAGKAFRLVYGETLVAVEIILAGDFWSDGRVDGADLLAWQRGDSPRSLSEADLDDWEGQFGASGAPDAPSRTIPEPELIRIVVVVWGTLVARRFAGSPRHSVGLPRRYGAAG